jgi:hypothetical protein
MDEVVVPNEQQDLPQVEKEWVSCCIKMDKGAVKYFTQISILSGLIIFSATMLVYDTDCNSQRNYASLLMLCLGTMVPSPKVN